MLLFVYVACVIAFQHYVFIMAVLNQVMPGVPWQTLQDAVFATVFAALFVILSVLHNVLWQPEPIAARSGWQGVVSALFGAGAGWMLGVVIVLGAANVAHLNLASITDHSGAVAILRQSANLLGTAIMPLIP